MAAGLQPDIELGASLFDALSGATRQGRGIVRDSYGAGEQAGHDIARGAAQRMGLEIGIDALGNLSMTLPGRDRAAPRIVMGSHLDSVPQGGNFDGAAGVVAGLSVLSGMRRAGYVPACDLTVMGIRAEESAWFDIAYLGSGGAFGLLDPACLTIARSDNGRSLEATLRERGFDPEAIRERRRLLDPAGIRAYLELHIEQGPTLSPAACRRRWSRASAAASASAMPAASASTRIRAPSIAPTAATPSPRPWRSCTRWKVCGLESWMPGPTWSSPAANCAPTPPCTARARSPARRASCWTSAASRTRPWRHSAPRPAAPPRASARPTGSASIWVSPATPRRR